METANGHEPTKCMHARTLPLTLHPPNYDARSSLMLVIMRIRFRVSDFGLVAKVNLIREKLEQASCAEMVLGSFAALLV